MTDAKPFEGITVGLFETRRQREFTAMFTARGAEVVACPVVFPESRGAEEPVRKFIEEATQGKFAVAIFYTGIGIQAIFDAAEQLGHREALKEALSRMTLVARGPKSKGALKRHNLAPAFLAEPPTTEGLVKRVEGLDVRGKRVAVALAGDHPSPTLTDAVERGGGEIYAFAPYHYRLPEDLSDIGAFIQKVLAGEVGWLVFTTPPQVSILMDAAEKLGLRERLVEAANSFGAVAAVGPVTAMELARYEVKVSVRPTEENETMTGLVNAIEGFLRKP
ncbi:MAG: hypothetical protein DMG26_16565 [Acidobacteria bacterium]|nr:MAG: hypothetical protein DMG26_16565 [Acidobacteriota bacterium]